MKGEKIDAGCQFCIQWGEGHMEKVIIFDLDGTLINSLGDIHAALNKVLRMRGATPLDLTTVRGFIGMGSKNLVMRALIAQNLPNDAASLAAGLDDFLSIYSAGAAELTYVFEGAKDALIHLCEQNIRLGICTNKPLQPTKIVLDQFGLSGFFDHITCGDQLSSRKPNPDMLYHVMAALGTDSCLFVGDSEVDRQTAAAAHQPFALFTEGYRKTSIEVLAPEYCFEDFARLPAIAEAAFCA